MVKFRKNSYSDLTNFLYQELAWGPFFKKQDGKYIKNMDNDSSIYIKESLKIMKIKISDLKNKKVFNIGTGRESRFFAKYGANVTHLDIGSETVKELRKWSKKNNKKINSFTSDIEKADIGHNTYDIIFLSGIYQHIKVPALSLIKFINSLKKNGIMYMGFYRSGEFKYFIVDSIRHLLNKNDLFEVRKLNSILFTQCDFYNYQSSRVMDDFFVPKKHNFHPKDVINDIKTLGSKVIHIKKDFRNYSHKGSSYFSIGGDRIYIKKTTDKICFEKDVKKKLRTYQGINQILDLKYKHKIIKENISLIKKIKILRTKKKVTKEDIIALCLGLYQFTRPINLEKSEYYYLTRKFGRHETINKYLKNFIKNFDQSKKENIKFNKKLAQLGLK